ncbi:hypothetical protein PTE30175_02371 [Pandoraea terrae]|uniref:Uncharacterized protein n=2 Tax=Pandoraea terrae TaxID=1537710 RepID=A0A5E4V4Z3_9BURK|nr:hypothetical protein PTE30175_02371 [Pandoraea terrae]
MRARRVAVTVVAPPVASDVAPPTLAVVAAVVAVADVAGVAHVFG